MGSANIQAKIKKGLAKAVSKTGSNASELVYLVKEVKTSGDPISPPTITKTDILLKNAIFKSFDKSVISENILTGDRMLVSDNTVEIKQGFTIKQGGVEYIVVDVDIKAPTSDILVYISHLRVK
jgi:hypothetical protein